MPGLKKPAFDEILFFLESEAKIGINRQPLFQFALHVFYDTVIMLRVLVPRCLEVP